jgi:hypothetical protein
MTSGFAVQVVSTFDCSPMEQSLRQAASVAGIAKEVRISPPQRLTEYMLAPSVDSEDIIGTIVVVRLEDWLRSSAEHQSAQLSDATARHQIREQLDEFLSHLAVLSMRGRPVWLLTCPSNGWIADRYKLATLCRTMSNLFIARVRNSAQIAILSWPAGLLSEETYDREADKSRHAPLVSSAYDLLGVSIVGQLTQRLLSDDAGTSASTNAGSAELAAFLARLLVNVSIVPASSSDRAHVDRLLRTAASFSLAGENPTISEHEVNHILQSEHCYLVNVSDRLSDYGASGLIAGRAADDILIIHAMSLSCTVLGKQVEYALLSGLAKIASAQQLRRIDFEFRPSGRNQPTLAFLKLATATTTIESHFTLPVNAIDSRVQQIALAPNQWQLKVQLAPAASQGA